MLIDRQNALFRAFLASCHKRGIPRRTLNEAIEAVEVRSGAMRFENSMAILRGYVSLGPKPAPVPAVPNWERLANEAVKISDGLFDKLQQLLASGAPLSELEAVRKQIERLGDEVRVAGLVIGMMSPWRPRRTADVIAMGPAAAVKTLFPWMQTALNWLAGKQVIKASEFPSLSLDAQQEAFTAPGIDDVSELRRIKKELADGQETGESLAQFRKRIGDSLALTRAQAETVFRTNVHQGLIVGFQKSMDSDALDDEFPAVMFSATHDNRVRELHWELDGIVVLRSDPAYQVMLRALKDYSCRCHLIPMTLEQAQENGGLKTFADLPADVVAKYGEGLSASKPAAAKPAKEVVPEKPKSQNEILASQLDGSGASLIEASGNDHPTANKIAAVYLENNFRPITRKPSQTLSEPEEMHEAEFAGVKIQYAPNLRDKAAHFLASHSGVTGYFGDNEFTKATPEKVRSQIKSVVFSNHKNSEDAYWQEQYNLPDFVSGATAGPNGQVVVYNGLDLQKSTADHEAGHMLAKETFGGIEPKIGSDYWKAAKTEEPVSQYGSLNPAEDFADAVKLFSTDPDAFKERFPKKHKALYDIIYPKGK